MAIVSGDILRVVATLLFPDDVVMQNVFHLLVDTIVDGDENTVTQDMDDYLEDIYANIDNNYNQNVDGDEIKVYKRDTVNDDWDEIGTSALTVAGLESTGILPHGVCMVLNFTTEDPDVQGRKFFGGFTNISLSNGSWAGGLLTNAAAAGLDITAQYTDPSSSNVYEPGVWSPTNNQIFDYGPTIFVNTIPGYQRRRKPGVGI